MRNTVLTTAAAALLLAGLAPAADKGLLNLVMPDAKVVSGFQVDQSKKSAFVQFLLSQMQADDANFQKLVSTTGFDPRRDLSEVIVASRGVGQQPGLVVARGQFDLQKIQAAVPAHGGTVTTTGGVVVIAHQDNGKASWVAFPDGSTVIAGPASEVQLALSRRGNTNALQDTTLAMKIAAVGNGDAWFASTVALQSPAATGTTSANSPANLLQNIQQSSGSLQFLDPNVQVNGEAITRSPQDATALANVIQFFAGMIQSQQNGQAQQLGALLKGMTVTPTGNSVAVSLTLPEAQLEQLIQQGKKMSVRRAHHLQ